VKSLLSSRVLRTIFVPVRFKERIHMIRKFLMRASAFGFLAIGAGLIALPVLAGSKECVRDMSNPMGFGDGYTGTDTTARCEALAEASCGGACGKAKWLIGLHCIDGGLRTKCDVQTPKTAAVDRQSGFCKKYYWVGTTGYRYCSCNLTSGSDWYHIDGDAKTQTDCDTNPLP
jgi:hypothetical protein